MAAILDSYNVETISLPITYRLPAGSVGSWGNQFYICDIISHAALTPQGERLIVLDCDCLWKKSVAAMEAAIDDHGALTYLLGEDEHPANEAINGLTRADMAHFLVANGGYQIDEIPYFGGEIFAASQSAIARIAERIERLWPAVLKQGAYAPREEAHLLSVCYQLEGIPSGSANPFIRRMWTTFHHNNLKPGDEALAIWHLPAEKRTGFAELFHAVAAGEPLDADFLNRAVGYPRRNLRKFAKDISLKIVEKLRA
jgi:hypothetical protein